METERVSNWAMNCAGEPGFSGGAPPAMDDIWCINRYRGQNIKAISVIRRRDLYHLVAMVAKGRDTFHLILGS